MKQSKKGRPTGNSAARSRAGGPPLPAKSISDPSRMLFWLLTVAASLVLVALALPAFQGRIYALGDLLHFHFPIRRFYANCLAAGESPDWFPNIYCGFYLHGEGQAGMYHPLHWLLYRLLPFNTAFNAELLLSYPAMLLGGYLWLRQRGFAKFAAVFGAALFTFCGFNLLHLTHLNMVAVVAHLPWLLLTIDWVVDAQHSHRVAGATAAMAFVIGSMLLLGHPQSVWLCGAVAIAYAGVRIAYQRHWSRFVPLFVAGMLGLMLGAVQWWPTWETLAASRRQAADEQFRAVGSLHPANLLQYVGPYLFTGRVVDDQLADNATHELALYAGALAPVFLIWIVLRWRELRDWRPFLVGAIALASLGLVLALGRYLQPMHWLMLRVPLVGLFRCPGRYCLWTYLGLAILSTVAITDLAGITIHGARVSWKSLAWLAFAPLASLLALAGVGIQSSAGSIWQMAEWSAGASGVVLSIAAAILVTATARGSRAALTAVALFALADLGYYGISFNRQQRQLDADEVVNLVPRFTVNPNRRYAVYPSSNLPTLFHARLFAGYSGLGPQFRLRSDMAWVQANLPLLLRLGSVESLINEQQQIPIPDPLERVRLVADARLINDLKADIVKIDCARTALVEQPVELDLGAPGAAAIRAEQPGLIEIDTNSPGRQLLVLSESFHPGWTATIDDRSEPALAVYGDFMGCPIPAGAQRVTFRFEPRSLIWGKRVSLAGLAIASLTLCISLLLARRRSTAKLFAF